MIKEPTLAEQLEGNGAVHFFNVWLVSVFNNVISKRGVELYNNKFVKYDSYTKKNNAHFFRVESIANAGHFYNVSIANPASFKMSFSCTCPYFKKNKECKHVAASMIYLGRKLEEKEHDKISQIAHSANYIYFSAPPQDLDKYLDKGFNQGYYYRSRFEILHLDTKKVDAVVWEGATSYKKYRVQIVNEDGWFLQRCTCGKRVGKLCNHQREILQEINRQKGSDYFFQIEVTKEVKDEIANTLNFRTFEEAEKYYHIKILVDGFSVAPKEKSVSNPLIDQNAIDSLADFLRVPSGNDDVSTIAFNPPEPTCIIINSDEFEYLITPAQTTFNSKGGFASKIKKLDYFNNDELDKAFRNYIELDAYFDERDGQFGNLIWKYRNELNKYPLFIDAGNNGVLVKGKCLPIRIADSRASVVIHEEKDSEFITLSHYLKLGNKTFDPSSKSIQKHSFFVEYKGKLYPYINYETQVMMAYGGKKEPIKILRNYESEYYKMVVPKLLKDSALTKEKTESRKIESKVKSVYLSEKKGFILFSPTITYDNVSVSVLDKDSEYWLDFEKGILLERDKNVEEKFLTFIEKLNPDFINQQNSETFYLSHEQMLNNAWFLSFSKALKEHDISIFGQKELKSFKYSVSSPSLSLQIESGIDWFDTKVELSFDGELIPLKKIKASLAKGNNFVELKDGKMGLLPEEWLKKLTSIFRLGKVDQKSLKVSKLHFNALDMFLDNIDDLELINELEEKKNKLKNFNEIEKCELPKALNATLRNYQKEGLNWISFLHNYGFGGILADDMGLGKTIQVISFLALQKEKGNLKTSLVVAPRSLIYNWQNEIAKFYPNLSSVIHHGTDRKTNIADHNDVDIVITTYGTLVNDIEFIKDYSFYYLILDESQSAKNYLSKRNKSLRLLQAKHKLALTGTPIENNSLDIYAQMQLINPYLLGDVTQFKNQFALPIDRDGNKDRSLELHKLLQPFVLRRTKKQVATELPEKVETILTCEMTPTQRQVYDATKNEIREGLLEGIDEKGIEKSSILILSAMLKLRQICLSTALPKLDGDFGNESAKISALIEQLEDMPKGSKALVFSQFVQMLDLVKDALDEQGIEYAYLTGKTQKREVQIDKFKNNDNVKLFLISLKAGGTGLNLTEADYVFVLDPWWNPAVEAQAIDRAYRIGQEKKVFAYKLICKDSIEEKIIELQKKKIALADSVIQTDESSFKNLTRNDIADIFS